MPTPDGNSSSLRDRLCAAGGGCERSVSDLCEQFRSYLLLVARREVHPGIKAKISGSDLVQDAIFTAQRRFHQFRGQTVRELRAWIRSILVRRALDVARSLRAQSSRDVSLDSALDEGALRGASSDRQPQFQPLPLDRLLVDESDAKLADALSQLPANYRQVIRLRTLERKSFEQVGQEMGRSAEATRKLWTRALARLRELWGPSLHDSTA